MSARTWALAALLALAGCDNEVPVLLYHWVGADNGLAWDLAPERFEQHLDELKRLGYTSLTLAELYDAREGRRELPERPVVLTFDDGEAGVYRYAFPALKARGLKAEIFLIESLIAAEARDRRYWVDGDARMWMLVWPEVREMAGSGVFGVHSHTVTHPHLRTIPLEQARREIVESRQLLAAKLGRPIDFFAYPGHSLDADVIAAVEAAGYRGAVAGQNRLGGDFALWRTSIHAGDDVEALRRKLARTWVDAD